MPLPVILSGFKIWNGEGSAVYRHKNGCGHFLSQLESKEVSLGHIMKPAISATIQQSML